MGCFDVSCGLSGITIKHGDDAVLLLIVPSSLEYPKYFYKDRKKVTIHQGLQQVHNEGPMGLYMPFCLPIRGKYNDYGALEPKYYVVFHDKAKNATNQKIKYPHIYYYETYGKDMDNELKSVWATGQADFCKEFMKLTGRGFNDGIILGIKKEMHELARMVRHISGMFIDGKVYDKMTESITTNLYARENSGILDRYPDHSMMPYMGFVYESTTEEANKEDSKMFYTHPLAPGMKFAVNAKRNMCIYFYTVKENGELVEVDRNKDGKYYSAFSAKDSAKMFKAFTGNELDLTELSKLDPIEILFDKFANSFKKKDEILKEIQMIKDEIGNRKYEDAPELFKKLWKYDDFDGERRHNKDAFGKYNFPFVVEMYKDLFLNPTPEFKESVRRYGNLYSSLWGINRMLMPSSHFSQHGEFLDQLVFSKIVADALKEKILGRDRGFGEKEELESIIELVYGSDWYTTPPEEITKTHGKTTVKRTVTKYMYKGDAVAEWIDHEEYGSGYLL